MAAVGRSGESLLYISFLLSPLFSRLVFRLRYSAAPLVVIPYSLTPRFAHLSLPPNVLFFCSTLLPFPVVGSEGRGVFGSTFRPKPGRLECLQKLQDNIMLNNKLSQLSSGWQRRTGGGGGGGGAREQGEQESKITTLSWPGAMTALGSHATQSRVRLQPRSCAALTALPRSSGTASAVTSKWRRRGRRGRWGTAATLDPPRHPVSRRRGRGRGRSRRGLEARPPPRLVPPRPANADPQGETQAQTLAAVARLWARARALQIGFAGWVVEVTCSFVTCIPIRHGPMRQPMRPVRVRGPGSPSAPKLHSNARVVHCG